MAKQSTTITTNTSVQLGMVVRRHDDLTWEALVFAYGTWGGGTLAYYWSPDNGTTKLPLNDLTGVAVVSTANDSFRASLLTGRKNNDKITIWATLTGATNPSLTVGYYDNN